MTINKFLFLFLLLFPSNGNISKQWTIPQPTKTGTKIKKNFYFHQFSGCETGQVVHKNTCPRGKLISSGHYWRRFLCRVPQSLGKQSNVLGKPFAECHTLQKLLSECDVGNDLFVEYLLSGTRQRVYRVSNNTRQSKVVVTTASDGGFTECLGLSSRENNKVQHTVSDYQLV